MIVYILSLKPSLQTAHSFITQAHLTTIATSTIGRTADAVVHRCRPVCRNAEWIIMADRGWPIFRAQLTRGETP